MEKCVERFLLTRRVITEKTRHFQVIKFYSLSASGRIYLDNFCMPEELYVLGAPPEDIEILPAKIVAVSKILKKKDGYYATEIKALSSHKESRRLVCMLNGNELGIFLSGTGNVNPQGLVENYQPFCLYLDNTL
jgi:hypothetical protein